MTSNSKPRYKFKISGVRMRQSCRNILNAMRRDALRFANHAIPATEIDTFEAEITALDNTPTDAEYEGATGTAVEHKNLKAEELREAIKEIMLRVNRAYPPKTAASNAYVGSDGALPRLKDRKLVSAAQRIARLAAEEFITLAAKGLTAAHITSAETVADELLALLAAHETAETARKTATEHRIAAHNALYDKLVEYAELGKQIWYGISPAKHHAYVIYSSRSPRRPPRAATSVTYINGVVEATFPQEVTGMRVFVSDTGEDDWKQVYEGVPAPVPIGVVRGVKFVGVQGRNVAGIGKFTSKKIVTALSKPASLHVSGGIFRIAPVIGADTYTLACGAPGSTPNDPATVIIYKGGSTEFPCPVSGAGTYNFFVKASAGGVESTWLTAEITFA